MNIKKVYAIYFSPTKGTKTYVNKIAEEFSTDFKEIDLTNPQNRQNKYIFDSNDLVIFGAPVYVGRLPKIKDGIFNCIKGNQTPAIFNVSYGNREFEDALLEEKNFCEQRGFKGIAAGAFIAPHTFSNKIASNRPTDEDFQKVHTFAEQIKLILSTDEWKTKELKVPGNYPYRSYKQVGFYPLGTQECCNCQSCIKVCPVEAIDIKNPKVTDEAKCISCFACVKSCPLEARKVMTEEFFASVTHLESNLIHPTKEVKTFLI